jgi:hypothetical protein
MTALVFLICAQYRISLFDPSTHLLALDVIPAAISYTVWCQSLLMPPLIYLLTPWSRVLLEKLTGLQLVKKFPAFYGTRRFITAFTSGDILRVNYMKCIGIYFIISVDRLQLNINTDSALYENSSLLGHYTMSSGKQVSIYQSTWCNVTEDFNFHQHCYENLKFYITLCVGRTGIAL